ncbi:MAG: diaminopimelate epimerase, partial [Bacteroidota bacterium]|nr:diaminopimelate epimerase [Bacteroidota bacterium]
MNIPFYKYQGTGNDFVMIDNRNDKFPRCNHELIATLCDRRFGIGADGVILLQNHNKVDFLMHYFNADGKPGSFCGNGARCIVAFAKQLEIIDSKTVFAAYDGLHEATIVDNVVSISMADVNDISIYPKHVFLDTGSPHHVAFVESTKKLDVPTEGALIAHNETYGEKGSNVHFVCV